MVNHQPRVRLANGLLRVTDNNIPDDQQGHVSVELHANENAHSGMLRLFAASLENAQQDRELTREGWVALPLPDGTTTVVVQPGTLTVGVYRLIAELFGRTDPGEINGPIVQIYRP